MEPSHVLVPLDGSSLALDALSYALKVHGGKITVLNVVTPIDTGMSEGSVVETDEERKEEARKRAERLVKKAKGSGVTETERAVKIAVEVGTPAEEILEYVEETDVDHIVMGSHSGDGNVTSRLLGTVSTKVVSEAPVSVTVIK